MQLSCDPMNFMTKSCDCHVAHLPLMTPSGLSMGMTLKMYLLRSATAEGVELTRNFRTPGEGRRRGGVVGGERRGGAECIRTYTYLS